MPVRLLPEGYVQAFPAAGDCFTSPPTPAWPAPLRRGFSLAPPYPFVQLATLRQRAEKAARPAGRLPAGQQTHRRVPLPDAWYVSQLQTMVATLKIPLERRNKRTGRTEKARLWEITDRTVRTWINEGVDAAAAGGVTFSVPVSPHTFRHAHALRGDPAEGAAEPDGAQIAQLNGSVHEVVCAGCGGPAPGTVCDAGRRRRGHAETVIPVSPPATG